VLFMPITWLLAHATISESVVCKFGVIGVLY
jgi:hypothetical protein